MLSRSRNWGLLSQLADKTVPHRPIQLKQFFSRGYVFQVAPTLCQVDRTVARILCCRLMRLCLWLLRVTALRHRKRAELDKGLRLSAMCFSHYPSYLSLSLVELCDLNQFLTLS